MNNFEEKLKKIKMHGASDAEKNSIWLGVSLKRELKSGEGKSLLMLIFKKYMVGAIIGLMIILGGGGMVAASNNAGPGDSLFGLDLAVEKAKLNLAANTEKKDELRLKFANERVAEAKAKSGENVNGSTNIRDVDLSAKSVTEIEADVFTNETTVKLEADNKHYGFVTAKKTRIEIVAEIAAKYNLVQSKVDSMLSLEVEDRASRADDKTFLNSSNSGSVKIKSEKEARDFEMSLKSLSANGELSAETQAKLNIAMAQIIAILEADTNNKIKIENGDIRFEVKENGMIKFKSDDEDKDENKGENDKDKDDKDGEDDNKGHGNDTDGVDEDNPGNSSGVDVNINAGAGVNLGGEN